MRVDSHLHLGDEDGLWTKGFHKRDFVPRLQERADLLHRLGFDRGNVIILDPDFLGHPRAVDRLLNAAPSTLFFSALLDPRQEDAREKLQRAANAGFRALKIHPYLFDLSVDEGDRCLDLAEAAASQGLATIVDASYGTLDVFNVNGVELVAELAKEVSSAPLVIAHGGGPRILEAMAVANAAENVYLDYSFSLDYWEGSSVPRDFRYVLGKLGGGKVMYGSDFPHVDPETYRRGCEALVEEAELDEENRRRFWGTTATQVFSLDDAG